MTLRTRSDFFAAARQYVGTPFHHLGRKKGAGVDCVGLVVAAARDIGVAIEDELVYARFPNPRKFVELIEKRLVADPEGYIASFWLSIPGFPCHLGILTDSETLIHSTAMVGKTVEHNLDNLWLLRVVKRYKIPGID